MSVGDGIWVTFGAAFVAVETWAIFYARGEYTLTRAVRRWLGVSPLRWWRIAAVPALWAGLAWLGWHFTA